MSKERDLPPDESAFGCTAVLIGVAGSLVGVLVGIALRLTVPPLVATRPSDDTIDWLAMVATVALAGWAGGGLVAQVDTIIGRRWPAARPSGNLAGMALLGLAFVLPLLTVAAVIFVAVPAGWGAFVLGGWLVLLLVVSGPPVIALALAAQRSRAAAHAQEHIRNVGAYSTLAIALRREDLERVLALIADPDDRLFIRLEPPHSERTYLSITVQNARPPTLTAEARLTHPLTRRRLNRGQLTRLDELGWKRDADLGSGLSASWPLEAGLGPPTAAIIRALVDVYGLAAGDELQARYGAR